MLLCIDIGNTSISLGGFENNKIIFRSKLTTVRLKSSDEYATLLKSTMELYHVDINSVKNAAVLSVVPTLTHTITRALSVFGIETLVIGPGVKTGLNIRVDMPSQVGSDIICNCVGALESVPAPLVVVDFGTATTVSVVNEQKQFCGCVITSGLKLSADALSTGCALLPDITMYTPQRLIGKNSGESINSGLVYGHAFMVDGFVKKIKEEYGFEKLNVVACGGFSELVAPLCNGDFTIIPDLGLYGLNSIYNKNNQ